MQWFNRMNLAAVPFNTARFPFFYGWIILIGGAAGVIMSVPGQTIGMSVFIEDLLQHFQLSRNQLSFAYMAGTLAGSFLLTWLGRQYDRHGIRIVLAFGLIGMALTLMYFQYLFAVSVRIFNAFPQIQPVILSLILLFTGFFGLRLLGQGAINILSRNMVMKWFNRKRGFANGIMSVIISFGFSSTPILLSRYKKLHGWSSTWQLLMLITLGFIVIELLLFRDNPSQCALCADGRKSPSANPEARKKQYTLDEATTTYSFWIFTLGLTMYCIIITAIIFHIESIFIHAGLPGSKGFTIFLPAAVIAVLFQFGGGWLSDFVPLKFIMIFHLFSMLVALSGLYLLSSSGAALWIMIAGLGSASGSFDALYTIVWPKFFGTKHLGAISGYSLAWLTIGSALGPFIFSIMAIQHSYLPAILLFSAVLIILLFMTFKADQPCQPDSQ